MLKKMLSKCLPWYKDDPWYCKLIISVEALAIAAAPFISIYLEVVKGKMPF